MRVWMVTGSRRLSVFEWKWAKATLAGAFKYGNPDTNRLIHGNANGIDKLAGDVATALCWPVTSFPANWRDSGRGAGFKRNAQMMAELDKARKDGYETQVVALFPQGIVTPGTKDSCHRAVSSGHYLVVYGLDDPATLSREFKAIDVGSISFHTGAEREVKRTDADGWPWP